MAFYPSLDSFFILHSLFPHFIFSLYCVTAFPIYLSNNRAPPLYSFPFIYGSIVYGSDYSEVRTKRDEKFFL